MPGCKLLCKCRKPPLNSVSGSAPAAMMTFLKFRASQRAIALMAGCSTSLRQRIKCQRLARHRVISAAAHVPLILEITAPSLVTPAVFTATLILFGRITPGKIKNLFGLLFSDTRKPERLSGQCRMNRIINLTQYGKLSNLLSIVPGHSGLINGLINNRENSD